MTLPMLNIHIIQLDDTHYQVKWANRAAGLHLSEDGWLLQSGGDRPIIKNVTLLPSGIIDWQAVMETQP